MCFKFGVGWILRLGVTTQAQAAVPGGAARPEDGTGSSLALPISSRSWGSNSGKLNCKESESFGFVFLKVCFHDPKTCLFG